MVHKKIYAPINPRLPWHSELTCILGLLKIENIVLAGVQNRGREQFFPKSHSNAYVR